MKKKKQTRKIKQWLVAALGLTLLGTGLWAGMNGEKLQAKPKKVSTRAFFDWETPPEKDRFFYGEGPLGEGGPNSIWQNVLGKETYDMIPKEYSFTLLPSDKTEYFVPDESKHLVMGETGDRVLFTPPVGEWASVIFTNMGYFQGESISLKLSFQVEKDLPSGQEPNVNGNTFAITTNKEDKNAFLMVSSGSLSGKGKVKYEFLKNDNQTSIEILSYFTQKSIINTIEYVIPEGLIKKLYTTKRDSDYPIDIKYSLGSEYFWFTGTDAWNTTEPDIRRTATFIFEDKEIDLAYGGSPLLQPGASANFGMRYTGETYAKIEFPDPQGIEQSFDRIDEVTEKELNYQFVQQVPYEGRFDEFGINNQDQTLKWTITSPIANQTVKADDWEVVDETGADRTGWFTFTDVDENTAEVIPNAAVVGNNASNGVAPSLDEFYNHYYTFKRKLTIDYTKPIVKERDGGKYLDKTGTVTLAVNGVAREEQEFKTSINFASTQDMKFYYVEDTEPWLPYYKPGLGIGNGGWLDSVTSYIPKDSVFTMMWNENSKLVEWSDSVSTEKDLNKLPKGKKNGATPPYDIEIEDTVAFPTNNTEAKWFRFENVGFHDGKSVGVKITIQTQKAIDSTYEGLSYIRYGKEYFLRVTTMAGTGSPTVTYQFLDENGAPFQKGLSGYNILGPITYHSSFKIPIDEIKNLYSVNREFTYEEKGYPTLIKYQVENNLLDLTSDIPVPSTPGVGRYLDEIQTKVTRTFPLNSTLTVTLYEDGRYSPADYSAQAVFLNPDTDVKIEFPDPQPTRCTYTEIIDSDDFKGIVNDIIKPLNYGFIQQIPWEGINEKFSINNRTQTPTWNLTAPKGNTTLIATDWEVVPQDNPTENSRTWFDMTGVDSIGNGSMFPKAEVLSKDEFYNHYYEFNRSLNIDYNKPIARTALKAKDGRYYFDYSGKVDLAVDDTNPTPEQAAGMNKNREEVNYDTAINFYAPLEYKYVNSVTGEEIPAGSLPTSAKPVGDGIVTWEAPLTPKQLTEESYTQETGQGDAPAIAGYAFDRSELNGSETDTQIKVTKLLRKKTQAEEAAGQTVDDTNPANYTQNNVVTLYYTPLNYQVEMTVKDSKDGEVLSPTEANPSAETHFQAAVVASKGADGWQDKPAEAIDWKPLSEIDFTALDKKYQIKQVSLVKEGYDWDKVTNGSPSNPSPKFWVELATNNETTEYQVKLETGYPLDPTDPYTNHGYLFPATLTVSGEGAAQTRALPLTVINKPIGELKLPTLDPIHFGTDQIEDKDGKIIEGVSLPRSTEKTMIQRSSTSTNWKIKVEDERLEPYQTGGWKLEATMTKDFTWTDPTDPTRKSVISNILVFRPDGKTFEEVSASPMGIGSTVVIKELDTGTKEITWAAENGFLLKVDQAKQNEIMAKGTDGNKYEAELEFVLTADPLPEPGK